MRPAACVPASTCEGPSCVSVTPPATTGSPPGPPLDATVLSDEHAEEFEDGRIRALGFTGAFVGMWAWDLTGGGLPVDFDEVTWRALRQHREAP